MARVRSWFKLVGTSSENLPDDWCETRADLLTVLRFASNKSPINISNYERIVLYAVGKQRVFAVQRRKGGIDSIRLNSPRGPKGSLTYRYPNEMDVETFAYVPNLTDAPHIDDVLPGFLPIYHTERNLFRQGSHFEIKPDEYDTLERAILDAGEGVPVEPPPWAKPGA